MNRMTIQVFHCTFWYNNLQRDILNKRGTLSHAHVRKHDDAIYLDHFASFLQRCHFSKGFASLNGDIVTIIGKYPLLLHISIAIGALDASRKGSINSFGELESPQHIAFRAYGRSIQDLHSAISTANPVFRDDVLWSTFLHGLFEVWLYS